MREIILSDLKWILMLSQWKTRTPKNQLGFQALKWALKGTFKWFCYTKALRVTGLPSRGKPCELSIACFLKSGFSWPTQVSLEQAPFTPLSLLQP